MGEEVPGKGSLDFSVKLKIFFFQLYIEKDDIIIGNELSGLFVQFAFYLWMLNQTLCIFINFSRLISL